MPAQKYPRLDIVTFGNQLIASGDIDPIYVMLVESKIDQEQLKRWLVAYWCYYNAGFASYASEFEGEKFWEVMHEASTNKTEAPIGGRWPRGKERRHYRGETSDISITKLRSKYPTPEEFVEYLLPKGFEHFLSVSQRVRQHYAFGDWIAFKVCDMLDRVLGAQIGFTEAEIFMFKDPEKAAFMLFDQQHPGILNRPGVKPKREKILAAVTGGLYEAFKHHAAPPRYDRQVNIQEVETVLCKWKSHMNGHYPVDNDIHEIREGLRPWADWGCKTAKIMFVAAPEPTVVDHA